MKKWIIPGSNYFEKPAGYPYKAVFMIVVIIFVAFFGYYALTIPQGGKYANELLRKAFNVPFALSMLMVGITATCYRVYAFGYRFADFLEQYGMYNWKNWAINTLVLLDYSSIIPVADLALKMQRLEGEAPISPATPLRIDIESDSIDESRLHQILMKLIEPLKESLSRGGYPFQTWLYVKGSDKSVCGELNSLFANLSIPNNLTGDIYYLEICPDYSLINKWIDEGTSQNRLLITIELHDESHSDFFENANAFVFTGQHLLKESDKPMYLLRTMDSESYHLDKTANVYFSAKQVEVDKIKRLWSSTLDKQAKFILYAAIENAKTGVTAGSCYELETVTGVASEVQQWALLALAADAAKYGQGHQIIACSIADKVYTGIVTSKNPGWWHKPWEFDVGFYWISTALFGICSFIFFIISIVPSEIFDGEGGGWILLGLIAFVVLFSIIGLGLIFHLMKTDIQDSMGIYHPEHY